MSEEDKKIIRENVKFIFFELCKIIKIPEIAKWLTKFMEKRSKK